MLTARGWWFLAIILGVLTLALGGLPTEVGTATPALAVLCLTLMAWFLGNWLAFVVKVRLIENHLGMDRRIRDERGELETLWARQPATVSVTLSCDSDVALPHVSMTDRVPVLVHRREGEAHAEGPLSRTQPLALSYRIECPAAGRLRFDGLKLRFTDLQGFFLANLFVRAARVYRVLPALADARGHIPAPKRHNLIPFLGTHPHRRPGTGSDLLDLRDYLPGDPPKMIAWKASARRDRLITKELESEVPIRCTLFLDTSNSVRIGPVGKNALARILEIASAVVQASARARDLTGLCFLDETGVGKQLRPGRGARHVLHLMQALADAGDLFPQTKAVPLARLIALAYGVIQDIYPDYLESDLNAFPLWLPMWSPQPVYTIPEPPEMSATGSGDPRRAPPAQPGRRWTRPFRWLWRRFRESPIAMHRWRLVRLYPYYHRLYRWRKQVAAVLSVRYGLNPGGLAMLLEDDELCRHYVERFLAEHQTPCPQLLYDKKGRYLFQAPAKLDVLAKALLASVQRGQDNELFVLLVDFLEAGPRLEKVLRAVRVARGRHHQVIVICPWPGGVPPLPPLAKGGKSLSPLTKGGQGGSGTAATAWPTLHEYLARASTIRVHQAFAHVRQAFGSLGVTVLAAPEEEAVNMILHRMHRLRVFQRGVR
jgi:uncharacterized protein (DUF58 family)